MPSETIRERIENNKSNDWLNVDNPRLALMDILWRAGNLIPADEVAASVAAAERTGMERALGRINGAIAALNALGRETTSGERAALVGVGAAIRDLMEADDG